MRVPKHVRTHGPSAAAGLVFLLIVFSPALGARSPLPAFWRGYSTLVVAGSASLEEVVQRLSVRIDRSRIVSALTSTVSITTFDGREDVPIAQLQSRLEARDPRYDPYMRKLPALFQASRDGGPAHVLYIRSGLAPALLSLRVGRLLGDLGAAWSIPLAPRENLLYLLAAFAFLAIVVAGAPGLQAVTIAVVSLPWLVNCLFGTLGDLLTFYLLFPFCWGFLTEARSHLTASGVRRPVDLAGPGLLSSLASLCAATTVACVLVALLGSPRDVGRVFTALAADGVLLGAFVAWGRSRSRGASHRLFVPVAIGRGLYRVAGLARPRRRLDLRPLLASARGLWVTRTVQVGALVALVCLSPFLPFLGGDRSGEALPVPVRAGSSAVSWDSLRGLWLASAADELPSVADLVAHEAYQSSLAFGAAYGLPARDELLTVTGFHAADTGVGTVMEKRVVLRFGDRWLRDVLRKARAKAGSADALLAAQGRAMRVRSSLEPTELEHGPEFWKTAMYSAMVVLFLVLGSHYVRPSLFSGRSKTAVVRRRQQEA